VRKVSDALPRGLAYLAATQVDDGSFIGYSSRTAQPFKQAHTYRTTFLPAVMLEALAAVDASKAIRQPLAEWVIAQRGEYWSFNYWAKDAPERQTMPYPDDLDDTFCALGGLYLHDPSLVNAAALGTIVKLLLAAESQVGGPYYTWLVGKDAPASWRDVDLAVNCNVAYFLQQVADPLPNLTALMDDAILQDRCTSPYYPSPAPVLYYLARAYRGTHRQALGNRIIAYRPRNSLETALHISALAHAGLPIPPEEVQALLAAQQADGSWPAAAFCLDAARQGRKYYHGSPALSTALSLEALQRALLAPQQEPPKKTNQTHAVYAQAQQYIATLQPDLRRQLEVMLSNVQASEAADEIILLPHIFAASLTPEPHIPDVARTTLGVANLYGWMAYTICDDILDGEEGRQLLPAATTAMRASLAAFATAVPNASFQQTVAETFTTIDSANAWEGSHCRFTVTDDRCTIPPLPTFGRLQQLAERSLGHTLTPLGVLVAAGYSLSGKPVQAVHTGLRHYLIARQLLDDLKDYEDDLRAGRLSAVGVTLLRAARIRPGDYALSDVLPRLRRAFWQRGLLAGCSQAEQHLQACRNALRASKVIAPDAPLYTLIDRLDDVRQQLLKEQHDATAFLATYTATNTKPLA
jgi:hypothetical protein